MVNFTLYEFYHNLKDGQNGLLCNIDEYGGRRRRGRQRMRCLDGITDSTEMSLSRLRELVMQRQNWHAAEGQGYVPSLLFDLRPNYYGGNEDNGHLLQKVPCKHCLTQCPQPCGRPLPTHASA